MGSPLHLAVALRATGDEAFSAKHWAEQVREAEEATLDFVTLDFVTLDFVTLDFVTLDDSLSGEPGLDAVLTAARVAPLTTHIGLIPRPSSRTPSRSTCRRRSRRSTT